MPDIDVDFCYARRPEVIEYVKKKYGKDCVVQIVTFGTLAKKTGDKKTLARQWSRRMLTATVWLAMIPKDVGITISKALNINPELKDLYDSDDTVKKTNRHVHEIRRTSKTDRNTCDRSSDLQERDK